MSTTMLSPWRLRRVGIECIDPLRIILRCLECHREWQPPQLEGKLPQCWWFCPGSCNMHIRSISRPNERRLVFRPFYHIERLFRRLIPHPRQAARLSPLAGSR